MQITEDQLVSKYLKILGVATALLFCSCSMGVVSFCIPGLLGEVTPTPWISQGPFYPNPNQFSWGRSSSDLLGEFESSYPALVLEGTVMGTDWKPISNAEIRIWQADPQGRYVAQFPGFVSQGQFGYFGRTFSQQETGSYHFRTLIPPPYRAGRFWRSRHIHLAVFIDGKCRLVTEVHFQDWNYLDQDWVMLDNLEENQQLISPVYLSSYLTQKGKTEPVNIVHFDIVLVDDPSPYTSATDQDAIIYLGSQ